MSDSPVNRTKQWLETVVIGLNLCPFARSEFATERIRYRVPAANDRESHTGELLSEFQILDSDAELATTLLIYPDGLESFEDYLEHLFACEDILSAAGYDGVYQIASFHPLYQFQGTEFDDPANFTNRSPYPTLHLLLEADLSAAIASHVDTEKIPARNQALFRSMGPDTLRKLWLKFSA